MTQCKSVKSGNEAVALAVMSAGVTAAYAYPGTPSTEIMGYLYGRMKNAFWCTNEKTALESALGVSFVGNRSFVSMKHVGLNVAADPFMSGANLKINGGIVVVVADDPGMHSSQNEQDTRYYADFARTICLEPSDVQEAYDMIIDAFSLSEKFNKIVLIRMCTRLSHSKGDLFQRQSLNLIQLPCGNAREWNVVPAYGKKNWERVLKEIPLIESFSEQCSYHFTNSQKGKVGVITTGIAKQYYLEQKCDLSHLHIGFYPFPKDKIKKFINDLDELYIIEEGYPYIERFLKPLLSTNLIIHGKLDGSFPLAGELNPDIVASGLHLVSKEEESILDSLECLPARPPQLCKGCPHYDSFRFIGSAVETNPEVVLNSDIGCYSLGSLPPFSLPITLVDMGASIPMAKGASDTGKRGVAIIGDSTFMHSGLTGLVDCVACQSAVVIIILDNLTTAMTGGQPQILPSQRIFEIVKAIGVSPDHLHVLTPLPNFHEKNVEILKNEILYNGVSVIISKRECIETLRKAQKQKG